MHALLSFFHNSLVLEFSLLIFVKALILGVQLLDSEEEVYTIVLPCVVQLVLL